MHHLMYQNGPNFEMNDKKERAPFEDIDQNETFQKYGLFLKV